MWSEPRAGVHLTPKVTGIPASVDALSACEVVQLLR